MIDEAIRLLEEALNDGDFQPAYHPRNFTCGPALRGTIERALAELESSTRKLRELEANDIKKDVAAAKRYAMLQRRCLAVAESLVHPDTSHALSDTLWMHDSVGETAWECLMTLAGSDEDPDDMIERLAL